MKLLKLLMLSLILIVPSMQTVAQEAAKPAAAQAAAKTPTLTREQFDAWLAKPDEILLIDVRRPDEVSTIGGFPVYLSIQSKELENSLDFIPKERAIITVSNHAGRAVKAADLLADKGFNVVGAVGVQTY